ncbi:MAG: hypothetical protein FIB07_11265 [Candidatus Methanoperedens sp.]|nr:hypothetical protein [Candidatus Methanoperedens sp.]
MIKLPGSKYNKIDALSKFIGLILIAVSIDNVSKGNYYIALFLFGLGGIIGILPIFIEVDTSA